ncbi:hypothetical protein WJX79_002166 [Trebouxia sp. C0005]
MAHLSVLRAFACLTVLVILTAPVTAGTALLAVTQWNGALQRTICKLSIANQICSGYFSLLHVAQYQALTVNNGKINDTAVAAFAAHFIAAEHFPNEWVMSASNCLAAVQTKQFLRFLYSNAISMAQGYASQLYSSFSTQPAVGGGLVASS